MEHGAPALLEALEHSGIGAAIRQSVWIYPTANVAHILALTLFVSAVAVMDLRLLGAFKATVPGSIIVPARRAAGLGFAAMLATGAVLFTAEASHVATNPVFLTKAALIGLGLANAALVHNRLRSWLATAAPLTPVPKKLRLAAGLSLAIWFCVAGAGRLIAYF